MKLPVLCSLCLLTASLLMALGCDKPTPSTVARRGQTAVVQSERDHFMIAADYLQRFNEHDRTYGQKNTLYHLNQWLTEQPPAEAWEVDPLAKQLPSALREQPLAQQYDRPSFDELDGRSLWEAALMKRVATWSLELAHDDPLLTNWYLAMEGTHGADHVYRLRMAARLFDWTIRNIQLDGLLPNPTTDAELPMLQGIPGPGYRFEPWQVMLFGRGDAWQRARVFIRLARQQQLDVVMLAVDTPNGSSPQPWLPALLLEGQLYLFDTQLGLPLPGHDATGIATLAELMAEPSLLEQYSVADHPYSITAEQLKGIEVLLDATPSELSQRMQRVEQNFIGQQKLQLTVDLSDLAKRLREVKGISQVRWWPVGVETLLYRANAGQLISRNANLYRDYLVREVLFQNSNPLSKARWQHLAGNFDSTNNKPAAKELYLECRNAEGTLALLAQSPQIQRQLGIDQRLRENPDQREILLSQAEMMLRQAAHDASYWLGSINYEQGKYEVALNWFDRQTLDNRTETIWESGAGYNVGRCYEQLNELEKALAHYRTIEPSPALAGELVRAKLLEKRFSN